jgi:SAM-dependent methyltransferase
MTRPRLAGALALLAFLTTLADAQDKSVRPGINDPFKDPDLDKFLKSFEGESREIFAQRKKIVAACELKPGLVVADVGAGTGLFTRLFAREVGPKGKVYAVEIAPKFLEHVRTTCKKAGLTNVETVLCKPDSVELPANSVDLVFICDTYHHFEFPFRTLASIHKALRPGGRVIVIDFHRVQGRRRGEVPEGELLPPLREGRAPQGGGALRQRMPALRQGPPSRQRMPARGRASGKALVPGRHWLALVP